MQNLYMMAALIKEQQLRKMAVEINQKLLSIEQAMIEYNISTREAVLDQLENLKRENKHQATGNQHEAINLNTQAA